MRTPWMTKKGIGTGLLLGLTVLLGCGKKEKPGWQQALETKKVVPLRDPAPDVGGPPPMDDKQLKDPRLNSTGPGSDFTIPPPPTLKSIESGKKPPANPPGDEKPKLGKPT